MFSIDQNCHSLWDSLPKVQALASRGQAVTHFIEDIDVAFTSLGSALEAGQLRLERERYHRSGGADWGAALFYSEFLGRLPVEIRRWEPCTGMKTAVLARHLHRSVDELYDEFSPSDNWQLVGPSYAGDKQHHRTIADLTAAEVEPFLHEILAKARANTLESFPAADSQRRTGEWFDRELARMASAIDGSRTLVEIYRKWMGGYVDGAGVELRKTSELFDPSQPRQEVLEIFTRHYDRAADLYNQAVEACDVGLRPLRREQGELPFFAFYSHGGHAVRSGVNLEGFSLRIAQRSFPLEAGGRLPRRALAEAGIGGLAGKAVLLVLQVRCGQGGQALAMPHRGSVYMPAAHRLEGLLRREGLLAGPLAPVMRVRFGLLDQLGGLDAPIVLPPHLRPYFGATEIAARVLGESWRDLAKDAAGRLERLKDAGFREQWQKQEFADVLGEIDQLDRRRRELAASDPKGAEIRKIWNDIKLRQVEMLDGLLRRIAGDWQLRDIDYWDSRGAILPWCIALGGREFYDKVLREAQVYPETGEENTNVTNEDE